MNTTAKRLLLRSLLAAAGATFTLTAAAQQPAPAPATDEVTQLAREQFMKGLDAFDAGKFEEARTHFLQAYAMKRHPAVLLNLGQAELKSGHLEDGGNHLQQFLREYKEAKPEQKQAAELGIQQARKLTGFVVIVADQNGANIAIDGKAIGQSPLLDPYFVAPGKHTATATLNGQTTSSDFTAQKGQSASVLLTLGAAAAAPVPAPVAPAPPMPAGPPTYVQPYPPSNMGMQQPPGGDSGTGSGGFVDWYTNDNYLAWGLTGGAGVGLILTFVGIGVWADANGAASDVQDQIIAEANSRGLDPNTICGPEDGSGSPNPNFAQACDQLRDNVDGQVPGQILFGVGLGLTGLAAASLAVYYLVDGDDTTTADLRFSPIVSPQTQGLGVTGSF